MAAPRLSPAGYPMAPSEEEWAALSPAERAAVAQALPGEVTDDEMAMPEGERHFEAKRRALDALRGYFRRQRRRIYLAAEMPTYYPAEPRFAPDLFAVLDVSDEVRDKWVVGAEGKGLDWVLEIHVGDDRKKDAERNVERYARLGIPEYFLYDRGRNHLAAYRLPAPDARSTRRSSPTTGCTSRRCWAWRWGAPQIGSSSTRGRRLSSRARSSSRSSRRCTIRSSAAPRRSGSAPTRRSKSSRACARSSPATRDEVCAALRLSLRASCRRPPERTCGSVIRRSSCSPGPEPRFLDGRHPASHLAPPAEFDLIDLAAAIAQVGVAIAKLGAVIAKLVAVIAKVGAAIAKLGAAIAKVGAVIAKVGAVIAKLGAAIANVGAAAPSLKPRQVRM